MLLNVNFALVASLFKFILNLFVFCVEIFMFSDTAQKCAYLIYSEIFIFLERGSDGIVFLGREEIRWVFLRCVSVCFLG